LIEQRFPIGIPAEHAVRGAMMRETQRFAANNRHHIDIDVALIVAAEGEH
jgi:hypothetical protein